MRFFRFTQKAETKTKKSKGKLGDRRKIHKEYPPFGISQKRWPDEKSRKFETTQIHFH